jgi:tRNA threonylcarbamoyladenosine biosynthesis protein TsaB
MGDAIDAALLERDVGRPAALGERPSGHGRELLPAIDALVAEAGIAKADIGTVAVSIGPGSYTGLRIGITAAKTVAWALGCDLVGVSTLEALAREAVQSAPEGTRRLVPVVDARQREVYAAVFDLEGGTVTRASGSDDQALPPAEFAKRLRDGDHVFGTGVGRWLEALALPEGATTADGPASPRAGTVARLGAESLARGERIDIHDAAPVYLRALEAERKASLG